MARRRKVLALFFPFCRDWLSYKENNHTCLYVFHVLCINKHTPQCLQMHSAFPDVFCYNCCSQTYPTDFSTHISSHNKRPGSHEDFFSFLNPHSIILPATSYSTKQFSLPLQRYQSGSQILHQAAPKPDHPPSPHVRYRPSGSHHENAGSPICKKLVPGDKEWKHLTESCCGAQNWDLPCHLSRVHAVLADNGTILRMPLLSCAITADCQLKTRFV